MIALLKPEPLDGTNVVYRAYLACDKCGRNHMDNAKAILTTRGTRGQLRAMESWAHKHGWFINTGHICPRCRVKENL